MHRPRASRAGFVLAVSAVAFSRAARAHVGGLSGATGSGSVPTWLTVVTGGVVVGASFLATSLLTDHDLLRAVTDWSVPLPAPRTRRRVATTAIRFGSVAGLVGVVAVGLVGPQTARLNAAVLVVWAGWWAGYTATVYLLGDTWPLCSPWRALASLLPGEPRLEYPAHLGVWPSVAGLLGLVYLEVVSPVAEDPRWLAGVVVSYTAVTLLGAGAFGSATWFGRVDPVARVFAWYGRVAPFQRTDRGVALVLPTTALTTSVPERRGETAFVVSLLWVTTYDGLVSTPAWAAAAGVPVGLGVPPLAVYLAVLVAGFAGFYALYRAAARRARRTADSYVASDFVARWFAPALVPIAAGYHLAHFLGYLLTLSPTLAAVLASPLSPPATVPVAVLPEWFGLLSLLFVLAGHLAAVLVGHVLAFELFPGVLTPIRSQYPFVLVMVAYTVTSLWIVTQPFGPPPYL